MSNELETRIADIKAHRQRNQQAADAELDRLKAALDDHAEQVKGRIETQIAERISDLGCKIMQNGAYADHAYRAQGEYEALAKRMSVSEAALRQQARRAWLLLGSAILAAGVIVLLAVLMASKLTTTAGREADAIRAAHARELATVREDGEREIAEAHAAFADQRLALEEDITAAGVELAALLADRDAVRADLDTFTALRARLGITLHETRTQIVVVVPEGQELRAWGAPGLSDHARYNGRMYRLVSKD